MEGRCETWEQEKLALQIQVNTLEDDLALYKARAGQTTPGGGAVLLEQAKAEAAELNRQRELWEKEKQNLRDQLTQAQKERRALEEQLAARKAAESQAPGSELDAVRQQIAWGKEKRELQHQLEQLQNERRMLEQKLAERDHYAERERSALETEIEQLMERLLRLHREHGSG